ncbi:MAG TPA: hypothetical protein VJ869_12980 [Sphaerochaeta sp.]|nr:hypothetical protein [Sphaerochaeta sp.]
MNTNAKKGMRDMKKESACFPSWFLTMTDSPPLLVLFAVTVLLCAPLLMIFGALYPLLKR